MDNFGLMKLAELREEEIRRKNEHDLMVKEFRGHRGSGSRLSRLFKGRGKDHSIK